MDSIEVFQVDKSAGLPHLADYCEAILPSFNIWPLYQGYQGNLQPFRVPLDSRI